MGKSLRASSRKSAKTKLRNTVHAPVEEARIQRLSTRLLALAASANPISDAMEVEHEGKFSPSYSTSNVKRHILKSESKKPAAKYNSTLFSALLAYHPELSHDEESDMNDELDPSLSNSQLATSTETNTSAQVQGQLLFELSIPQSLVDEDSSGDESEDDAFYATLALFGNEILGFGLGDTIQVAMS